MSNKQKIKIILKFWCVLTIYHLIAWLLSQIIAKNIYPLIDLVILVGLNWKEFEYAQMIFDNFIGPLYMNNKEQIQNITEHIEQLFNKKTQSLKNKVSESTAERIIGQILVGALNPTQKKIKTKKQKQHQNRQDSDDNDNESDKDQ